MSPSSENKLRDTASRTEIESKPVGEQPTAVPEMSPVQQQAEKAGRLRGGCIPCPVRSSFLVYNSRLRNGRIVYMLLLHSHTFPHLTERLRKEFNCTTSTPHDPFLSFYYRGLLPWWIVPLYFSLLCCGLASFFRVTSFHIVQCEPSVHKPLSHLVVSQVIGLFELSRLHRAFFRVYP